MITLRLQRQRGPFWRDYGQVCDGGPDAQDAEELALHWLAEIYAGTISVHWPGPYRVAVFDPETSTVAYVSQDHPRFEAAYRDEVWREREREEDLRMTTRRNK